MKLGRLWILGVLSLLNSVICGFLEHQVQETRLSMDFRSTEFMKLIHL
jgi:hypothetical protein